MDIQEKRIVELEKKVQRLQEAFEELQFIQNTEQAYQEYERGEFERLPLNEFIKQAKQW